MITDPGTVTTLAAHPGLLSWVQRLEVAAGKDAWVKINIEKRDGVPYTVQVTCTMKCGAGSEDR